jgi:hypothetical protein
MFISVLRGNIRVSLSAPRFASASRFEPLEVEARFVQRVSQAYNALMKSKPTRRDALICAPSVAASAALPVAAPAPKPAWLVAAEVDLRVDPYLALNFQHGTELAESRSRTRRRRHRR